MLYYVCMEDFVIYFKKDKGIRMDNVLKEKVKIGISACMYGCKVRYNNKGWDMVCYLGREKNSFTWYPVCPEVMAGLGVPRDPIRVVGESGIEVWEGKAKIKNRKGQDVTEDIKRGAMVCLETLKKAGVYVYIFMEGSPSCGVYRTTLKNKRVGKPPGVFGALLLKEGFFLIPAVELQSPIKRWDWRRRLHAFVWMKNLEIQSKNDIYDMWHIMKFICQEIDNEGARKLGKKLANLPKVFDKNEFEIIRNEILDLLRQPSSVAKIKQMLWKNYTFYRRKYDITINEEILDPTVPRNMTKIAKELMAMEKQAYQDGNFFGSAPIIYRNQR